MPIPPPSFIEENPGSKPAPGGIATGRWWCAAAAAAVAAATAPTGAPANDAAEIIAAALAAVMLAEFAGAELQAAWVVVAKSRGGGRLTPGSDGYCRPYGKYIGIGGGCGSNSCCGGEDGGKGADGAATPAVALPPQFCNAW